MIRALTLILALVFVAGGCSDDDTEQSPTAGAVIEPTATIQATKAPSPTPEPSPTVAAPDWDVESCEEMADLYIARLQVLLDEMADADLSEFTGDAQPESMRTFQGRHEPDSYHLR